MTTADGVFFLASVLSLGFAHYHKGETETYHVSPGHLFLMKCPTADSDTNITWSHEGEHNLSLPAGVEVRNGTLWFLPVQVSHDGSYICEKRDETGLFKFTLGLSVSSGECPDLSETISITMGVTDGLPCKQKEILELNNTRNIQWMKDCSPIRRHGEPISVEEDGFMMLPLASQRDAGIYTCLVDINVDGRSYTSARSIKLTINSDKVMPEPKVVSPQQEVVVVDVGTRVELKCLAYIGFSEDNETLIYWTVDGIYAEDHDELHESWKYVNDGDWVFGLSTLIISEVPRQFLNVPIGCCVMTPTGVKVAFVSLQEADHSALYTSVTLCILSPLTVLILAAALIFFKVDLVLAYRNLSGRFANQSAPDGKLYDAYVSFLHSDSLSSAETMKFTRQILPEELERKHGFSLYIRGRDDCPGEAMHDAVAATLRQCRRLILILSPDAVCCSGVKTEEAPIHNNMNQLCYEHKVGLYDALTQNSPRVILLEIDGPVDYSLLPESLRYIKRKQGALRWRTPHTGTHKLMKLDPNRNLWKNLRYHMPPVSSGKLKTLV
ncbi:interleukin-1 receptor type 1-like [Cheilinus undulatus]|uniref:interleukin-1 receptor type 1-like n=1 Tax=Cheilinus undulatus TaxID=241271 RepID=UPI001BD692DD|nr:interleukin-1 receptor type 1-like [Cheilinus undulatus]